MNDVQSAILEMMIDFDAVMRKHGVDYSISDGTALGAVRHKGFIPWDDDADLSVLRKDVPKFLEAMEDLESSGKYFLQRPLSIDWPYVFYKVRLNNSTAIEDKFVNTRMHQGLFIDIFIADPYPNSKIRRGVHGMLMFIQHCFQTICDYRMGKRWFDPILKIVGISVKVLNKMMDMVVEKDYRWYCNRNTNYHRVFYREDMDETIETEFEGHSFRMMKGYDRYLKELYGDYMTPPPEDQRYGEHLSFFDKEMDYKDWLAKNRR